MIALLVAYGYDKAKSQQWKRFTKKVGIPDTSQLVVDNAGGEYADLVGSNDQYEFSGYAEGLSVVRTHWPVAERVMVFNDTLFSHHWASGWARLLAHEPGHGIWGDLRVDQLDDGRELRFAASWQFDLVGREAINALCTGLDDVLESFGRTDRDGPYERYVCNYLQSRPWSGYSDPGRLLNRDERLRKEHCIRAEHRLSGHSLVAPLLRGHSGRLFSTVRNVDRMLSMNRRTRALLRRPIE